MSTPDLPSGFTELEYMQSSGTQYIIVPEEFVLGADIPSSGVKMKLYLHDAKWFNPLWGIDPFVSPVVGNASLYIGRGAADNFSVLIYGKTGIHFPKQAVIWTGYYNFLDSKKMGIILATGESKEGDYMVKTWKASAQFENQCLFGLIKSDGSITKGVARIYEAQFSQGSEITHDLVPVLDADNTPCMYDKVTRQCFYNTGTGKFGYKIKATGEVVAPKST